MPKAINLVCTRCTDGNHADLQRWYNDHAQLLMVSSDLQAAYLYQLKESINKINYFCLYEFEDLKAFSAFDAGPVMQKVRDLSNAAGGRTSIEIVKRTQYERLLHRRWPSSGCAGDASHSQASMLTVQGKDTEQVTRWINDAIYQLHRLHPLQLAQVYSSACGESLEVFVLLQSGQSVPLGWQEWDSAFAPRPDTQLFWQVKVAEVAQWLK